MSFNQNCRARWLSVLIGSTAVTITIILGFFSVYQISFQKVCLYAFPLVIILTLFILTFYYITNRKLPTCKRCGKHVAYEKISDKSLCPRCQGIVDNRKSDSKLGVEISTENNEVDNCEELKKYQKTCTRSATLILILIVLVSGIYLAVLLPHLLDESMRNIDQVISSTLN